MTAPRKAKGAAHGEGAPSSWTEHLGVFSTARTAREAMRQGNHLLVLKKVAPQGTWRNLVNMLGIPARNAESLMAVARRFAGAPDVLFAAVGKESKLLELLPLEPDQVEALCRGKDLHGLTLERIAKMPVLELRSEVRTLLTTEGLTLQPQRPKTVRLSVEEERMLRLFRQCNVPAREALCSMAGLLAQP